MALCFYKFEIIAFELVAEIPVKYDGNTCEWPSTC